MKFPADNDPNAIQSIELTGSFAPLDLLRSSQEQKSQILSKFWTIEKLLALTKFLIGGLIQLLQDFIGGGGLDTSLGEFQLFSQCFETV